MGVQKVDFQKHGIFGDVEEVEATGDLVANPIPHVEGVHIGGAK